MKRRKGKKAIKIFAVIGAVLLFFVAFFFSYGEISMVCAHKWKPWRPDYQKTDIRAIVEKLEKTPADYEKIYEQTGLTKLGVDGFIQKGKANKIYQIQEAYFEKPAIVRSSVGFYACLEESESVMPHCELEAGDIIVSSSTHVMNFRLGHAGLILNSYGNVLEGLRPGEPSDVAGISVFTGMASFMVLRPKLSKEIRASAASYATDRLVGVEYSLFTGIFTKKNSIRKTQCAHIVWYAYKRLGFDLDSNGGLVVTPSEIANSPHVEVVQVYGFDPQKLWK